MTDADWREREPVAAQPLVADDGSATPWAEARERLETPERERTYWLATADASCFASA